MEPTKASKKKKGNGMVAPVQKTPRLAIQGQLNEAVNITHTNTPHSGTFHIKTIDGKILFICLLLMITPCSASGAQQGPNTLATATIIGVLAGTRRPRWPLHLAQRIQQVRKTITKKQ